MQVGFIGFVVAVVGVVTGFLSFYVEQRWLGIFALVVTATGVLTGFLGVIYGWARHGREAIKGSAKGATELRAKLHGK